LTASFADRRSGTSVTLSRTQSRTAAQLNVYDGHNAEIELYPTSA
jgi:hypothetical protein